MRILKRILLITTASLAWALVFLLFWLRKLEDVPHRPFLSELALLERTMEEIFDAPRAEPVSIDDLLRIPQESWFGAHFRFVSAYRAHAFEYPVNTYLQAVRDKNPIDIPQSEKTWLIVYRRNYTVWRFEIDEIQFNLLSALSLGKSLVESLEICTEAPGVDVDKIAGSLRSWFQDWTGMGLFSAVEI